ncbi:MAG: WGR domain-containing protein [Anaerolineae bacterium]|nr:WGR domain-containing protein [Anaerolineae bacterium]
MLLHRINPEKNEARFYLVIVAPTLLDSIAVWRVWGRIGGAQRSKIDPCGSAAEAEKLAEALIRRKIKRGYKPCGSPQGDRVAGEPDEQEKEKANPQGSQPEPAAAGDSTSRPTGGDLSGVRKRRDRARNRKFSQPGPPSNGPLQIELL